MVGVGTERDADVGDVTVTYYGMVRTPVTLVAGAQLQDVQAVQGEVDSLARLGTDHKWTPGRPVAVDAHWQAGQVARGLI